MRFKVGLFFLLLVLSGIWFWPLSLKSADSTWYFYDQHGELLYKDSPRYTDETPMPEFLSSALVTLEDQNFAFHAGVDFKALGRAAWQNTQSGRTVSGASTITMQLARLQFMPQADRDWWYKIRQIFLALKLEQNYAKDEILSLYLEGVNLGHGTTGFRHGAQRYFSKSIDQLSIGEIAVLLAMVQNPSAFNPIDHPARALERRNLILARLNEGELLTVEQRNYWQSQPIKLNIGYQNSITAPHFVFWVKAQLRHLQAFDQDLHIYTTLDKDLYEDTLRMVRETIERQRLEKKITNGAVVVLDENNAVLAMLGSPDYFDTTISGAVNMATSPRQTGSVLKPFLYAKGIELGFSPASALNDTQTLFPDGYGPRNFNIEEENGPVRYREALANSYNIAAVDLLNRMGVNAFYNFLQSLGLDLKSSPETLGLSIALGSTESSLLNVTRAFSAFTNQGQLTPVSFLTRVTDKSGQILYEPPSVVAKQVMSLDTAEWGQHVLSDDEARWKNFSRGNSLELPFASGAKTGTSQAFRDNWVVGFSPRYTVGVWVGNADGTPMVASSGMQGAGPIWQRVMQRLHQNESHLSFDYEGQRVLSSGCRRPLMQDCAETVSLFLTPNEKKMDQNLNRSEVVAPFRISYPADGSVFVAGSELLVQHRPAKEVITEYRFNQVPFTGPIYPNLPIGSHNIELITLDGQSAMVQIRVEEL